MSQAKKQNFEKQMERLAAVVAALEKGDLPLDKSVTLYKEGVALVKGCRDQLQAARQEVRIHDGDTLTEFPELEENE